MMKSWRRNPVEWQGKMAKALLADAQEGVVAGTSSRGIFLHLDSGWTVFLSYEGFRGPLTLNLSREGLSLDRVGTGSRAIIREGKIQTPATGSEIDFSEAESWEAPSRAAALLSMEGRTEALTAVARLVLTGQRAPGLSLALNILLGLEASQPGRLPAPYGQVDPARLLQCLRTADPEAILPALTPLLGLGTGLTPAGDDLILGLILAAHRWGDALRLAFDAAGLESLLSRAASERTTGLSANLIACAAQGQADERLITALDGMMTGSPAPESCAHSLLSWGSSSGGDALVGMALAMVS